MTVDMTTDALKRLAADNRDDPQYLAALGLMVLTGRTATSLVQRALGIGYNAAARIVERIEADGIISRPNSAGKRELIERREADAPVTAREAVPSALRYVPTVTTDNCRTPPQPSETVAEAADARLATREDLLAGEILAELTRARAKFPGKNVTFAALVEEVGELATAVFEEGADRVRKEAVQVAVMAMRMILDGDHCFEPWRAEKGLDPLDPALRAAAPEAEGGKHER